VAVIRWTEKGHENIYRTYRIRLEILTSVIMNTVIFCEIAPCSSYVNRHLRGTYSLHLLILSLSDQETSVQRLVSFSADSSILTMEVIPALGMSVHIRTTWRYIQEDDNIQNVIKLDELWD
jgi:hypothetical protein